MADKEPKQTRQDGDGRKDERKGVEPGQDIADQGDLANAQGGPATGADHSSGKAHGNSQGGQWGKHRGKGGDDAHNKR